jgi:hypothetical protein
MDANKIAVWESVVAQIYKWMQVDTAVLDSHGLVIASKIPEFKKNMLISPMIWNMLLGKQTLKAELGIKTISSFSLDTDIGNLTFVFGHFVHLVCQFKSGVNFQQNLPLIYQFFGGLDKATDNALNLQMEKFDFTEEYNYLLNRKQDTQVDNFPVFKSLIKSLSKI